ncbi:AMP deaminase 2 [Bienertia sinuspersici]
MEIALAYKRKLGFATGAIVKDRSDPVKQEAWETCNNMVISWILGNVTENIQKSKMFMNTARDMWKNLEQRFQISNGARKYQVCKMIYETKQNGKPVNEYYTEMKILWEELENLNVYPPITDINPEVAAYLSAKHQQDEEHKLFQFLNGLDELNGAIRSQLLMYSALPSVDEACCVIQQEESQRQTLKSVKEEPDTLDIPHGMEVVKEKGEQKNNQEIEEEEVKEEEEEEVECQEEEQRWQIMCKTKRESLLKAQKKGQET